jgi:hypothetical protein
MWISSSFSVGVGALMTCRTEPTSVVLEVMLFQSNVVDFWTAGGACCAAATTPSVATVATSATARSRLVISRIIFI